jgi:hypothetical protein
VVEGAGGREDELVAAVVVPVVRGDDVAREGHHGLRGSADGAAERVRAEHGLGEALVRDVVGVVLRGGQLVEDDTALGLQLVGVEGRRREHVGDDVEREGRVGVEDAGVVAGRLLAGRGVGLAADGVEGLRDVQRRAPPGALKQEVLEHVGGAVVAPGLVPRADGDPRTDRDGALAGDLLGEDADAAREDRAPGERAAGAPGHLRSGGACGGDDEGTRSGLGTV